MMIHFMFLGNGCRINVRDFLFCFVNADKMFYYCKRYIMKTCLNGMVVWIKKKSCKREDLF